MGVIFVFPPKEPTIEVGDKWVFTGEWTMEQMQALQRLHDNLYGVTVDDLLSEHDTTEQVR